MHDGMRGRYLPLEPTLQGSEKCSCLILNKLNRTFGAAIGRAFSNVAVLWYCDLNRIRLEIDKVSLQIVDNLFAKKACELLLISFVNIRVTRKIKLLIFSTRFTNSILNQSFERFVLI